MKKVLALFILILVLWATFVMAYDLSESDNNLLDTVENKLIRVIDDESNGISAEAVVSYIYSVIDTRTSLSDRQKTLLDIIADDISWEYEIGEYARWENEIMTADMCYPDEYFDSEEEQCYFQEDEDYDDETEYEAGAFSGDEESESEIIASYDIRWDRIELTSGVDDVKNQEVWNIFTALIPLSVRGDFARYEISNDPESDTAAHVQQTEWDNTKWLLNVNLDSFYIDGVFEPEESYATLIHEFSHVMTLNKTQVRYYPETDDENLLERFDASCDGNILQEWCLDENAYLDDFINLFWSDQAYLEKVRNEKTSAYEDTPENFVTEYAGTNPGEDIAESFTYFVLRAKPTGDTIADKKLQFFYSYKELESLRKQIRTNLAELK